MATARPVASTDVGDIRAMLPEAQGDFLTDRDEAALAAALRLLITDAGLRARLGAENRARAEAEFDQVRMFEAYAALIEGGSPAG
jgi:glycosyltransferase involved in cell wall biosynthesis